MDDRDDWVRREILLARAGDTAVVPVLVDRQNGLREGALPQELRFLAGLQSFARTRTAVDALLRRILPSAQQAGGNRERLLELCMSLPTSRDWLVDLAPARLPGRPNGSAVVILTETDVVIADIDTRFRIAGEIRFPKATIVRADVVPTRRLGVMPTADVALHSTTGDRVELLGLFRNQAQRLADLLTT